MINLIELAFDQAELEKTDVDTKFNNFELYCNALHERISIASKAVSALVKQHKDDAEAMYQLSQGLQVTTTDPQRLPDTLSRGLVEVRIFYADIV